MAIKIIGLASADKGTHGFSRDKKVSGVVILVVGHSKSRTITQQTTA